MARPEYFYAYKEVTVNEGNYLKYLNQMLLREHDLKTTPRRLVLLYKY